MIDKKSFQGLGGHKIMCILLSKLGGKVEITDKELEEFDFINTYIVEDRSSIGIREIALLNELPFEIQKEL